METLVINIPDNKSAQVKKYLKELGVSIERESKASRLARALNHSVLPGKKPSMSEIVKKTRLIRSQIKKSYLKSEKQVYLHGQNRC